MWMSKCQEHYATSYTGIKLYFKALLHLAWRYVWTENIVIIIHLLDVTQMIWYGKCWIRFVVCLIFSCRWERPGIVFIIELKAKFEKISWKFRKFSKKFGLCDRMSHVTIFFWQQIYFFLQIIKRFLSAKNIGFFW